MRRLNRHPDRSGGYVLYWMQAAQRVRGNHALEWAVRRANERREPLVVVFGLTDGYPEANLRHYAFLLEGLREAAEALRDRGVAFVLRREDPDAAAVRLGEDASLVVADRGYTHAQREWRARAAEALGCSLIEVEGEVVVPVDAVSSKEEHAAWTLRRKVQPLLDEYLVPLRETDPGRESLGLDVGPRFPEDLDALLADLEIDRTVGRVRAFRGGTSEAEALLRDFVEPGLADYPEARNDPARDHTSHLSPYLHFGQIAPLEVALTVREAGGPGADAFLEQLIVRRELSMNFTEHNPLYDQYQGLPDWARRTLDAHRDDPRPETYALDELEAAATGDPYWNAAQREMVVTGYMHNTMRMYWAKRILEWSPTPEAAFDRALLLNNRYQLDGRDPNSFAGIAWCFGKHDRPWGERSVFGMVRCMTPGGLKRKYDMEGYLRRVAALEA